MIELYECNRCCNRKYPKEIHSIVHGSEKDIILCEQCFCEQFGGEGFPDNRT